MANTSCIVLKVYHDCKLLSVTPYPMVNEDKVSLHSSLEIARKAKDKLQEHINCERGSSTFAELGFGVVDEHGNIIRS